jgi:hypothetical protein
MPTSSNLRLSVAMQFLLQSRPRFSNRSEIQHWRWILQRKRRSKTSFNPITFNGNCGCTARVSDCGCNTSFAPNQYGSPLIQIIDSPIQTQDTFIPNPPVPPTDESNIIIPEPARFKPGQWERASYQQQNSVRNPQLYYSRVMAERARLYGPTSHPTSYYAPVQRVGTR